MESKLTAAFSQTGQVNGKWGMMEYSCEGTMDHNHSTCSAIAMPKGITLGSQIAG